MIVCESGTASSASRTGSVGLLGSGSFGAVLRAAVAFGFQLRTAGDLPLLVQTGKSPTQLDVGLPGGFRSVFPLDFVFDGIGLGALSNDAHRDAVAKKVQRELGALLVNALLWLPRAFRLGEAPPMNEIPVLAALICLLGHDLLGVVLDNVTGLVTGTAPSSTAAFAAATAAAAAADHRPFRDTAATAGHQDAVAAVGRALLGFIVVVDARFNSIIVSDAASRRSRDSIVALHVRGRWR